MKFYFDLSDRAIPRVLSSCDALIGLRARVSARNLGGGSKGWFENQRARSWNVWAADSAQMCTARRAESSCKPKQFKHEQIKFGDNTHLQSQWCHCHRLSFVTGRITFEAVCLTSNKKNAARHSHKDSSVKTILPIYFFFQLMLKSSLMIHRVSWLSLIDIGL